jgi:kynureninase
MTTPTFTITLGLESPKLTVEECRALALIAAAEHFPSGHTITEATGRWTSDRGVIDEPSLVITVITDDRAAVDLFCQTYKVGAFQDCVLLQITRPETIWV